MVPRTGDTLYDALQAAILVQEEAFEMLQDAMRDGEDATVSIRLSVHNKAIEARYKAEEMYRAELERRGMLVSWTAAAELFRRGFEVMMNRMRRLPQSMAQRCNPQNPLVSYTVLEAEMESIIATAQREYGDTDSLVPRRGGG